VSDYTAAQLHAMPTIKTGHFDNLKIQTEDEQVWLSRTGVADGEAYDNKITVQWLREGKWVKVHEYPGGPIDPPFAHAGSISHGTLREVDLIPTFMDVLRELDPARAGELAEEERKAMNALDGTYEKDPEFSDADLAREVEAAGEFLVEVTDALDHAAPDGYHFGTHEGDGSDFGFWLNEDDEDEEEGEDPDTYLDGVDGHWYNVEYGRDPRDSPTHAADCETCSTGLAAQPPVAPLGHTIRTWADGFGVWHARVVIDSTKVGNADSAMVAARAFIGQELREREPVRIVEEFLQSDRYWLEQIDGETIPVGSWYEFKEGDPDKGQSPA
jgi:hypothetical protein